MLPASLDWSLPCLNHPPSFYASLCPLPIVVVVLCPSPLLRPPIAEAPLPSLPFPASLAPSCSAVDSRVGRHIFHRCIGPRRRDGRQDPPAGHAPKAVPAALRPRPGYPQGPRGCARGVAGPQGAEAPGARGAATGAAVFRIASNTPEEVLLRVREETKTALLGPPVPHISPLHRPLCAFVML